MCGRYALTSNLDALQARFKFEARFDLEARYEAHDLGYQPRYNIAPTQKSLVVTNDGSRRCEEMRWGLVPFWAKDIKIGYRMINAVGETLSTKPAFRAAYKKRRCLVLANGFFEWRKDGKARIPFYLHLGGQPPFAFAGLWETWRSGDGETVKSFTIVTTKPNKLIEPIHNRMPVILSQETEALWLDPMTEDTEILDKLLRPAPVGDMAGYQVSQMVNSPRDSGPECIQRVESVEPAASSGAPLFNG